MKTWTAITLLLLLATVSDLAQGAVTADIVTMTLARWKRQAGHCPPGDPACAAKCSGSCNVIGISNFPECCESYKICCEEYFSTCKQCSNVVGQDKFFPEYCCASFTECCDLITTFTTEVKAPIPVKIKPKTKAGLAIPVTPAPRPDSFPGFARTPDAAPAFSAVPAVAPVAAAVAPAAAPATRGRGRGRGRGQTRAGTRRPSHQQNQAPGPSRRGRVSSRGRVL